jgi:group I intron endonuclease
MKCGSLGTAAAESIQNMPTQSVRSRRRAPSRTTIRRLIGRARSQKHRSAIRFENETTDIPRAPGIYCIICRSNGKLYIGSTVDLLSRWRAHRNLLRRKKHTNGRLQQAWNRHREINFEFKVLERVRPSRRLAIEQSWLNRSHCIDRNIGFNVHSRAFAAGRFGAQTWKGFSDPRGKRVTIKNLRDFCRRNLLDSPSMIRLFQGRSKLKSYKGWTHENSVRVRDYAKTYEGFIKPNGKSAGKITNLAAFCRRHSLHPTIMGTIAAGKNINHRGWPYKDGKKRLLPMKHTGFISPDGRRIVIINLSKFCRENGLSIVHMHNLKSGIRKIHKGWTWRMN